MIVKPSVVPFILAAILSPCSGMARDPLSAISWLSDSVSAPPAHMDSFDLPEEPNVAQNAGIDSISVTPISPATGLSVGVLPVSVTGLPVDLWGSSNSDDLAQLIRTQPVKTLPALQDLLHMLLLAEVDAPFDGDPDNGLFLSRVDKLLEIGAVDQAQSLLDLAHPDTPSLFGRWFDVSLLNGTDDKACERLINTPDFAPTIASRVYCLVQNGDWNTASLTYETAKALGDVDKTIQPLIERFLDPELFSADLNLTKGIRITPLIFRMSEASGEYIPTAPLARIFANADLRSTAGWKAQLEAAERLVATGAIDENRLLGLYTERKPSASGGVWDRAAAVQNFEDAVNRYDTGAVSKTLPMVWVKMQEAGLRGTFADMFAVELAKLPLANTAGAIAFKAGLLSENYEAVAKNHQAQDPMERFLIALALGTPNDAPAPDARAKAITAGFQQGVTLSELDGAIHDKRLGETILRSLLDFTQGLGGDMDSTRKSLIIFRKIGLEDTARRAALQLMILGNNQ